MTKKWLIFIVLLSCFCFLYDSIFGYIPFVPERLYDDNEIIWFQASDKTLVLYRYDGLVQSWNLQNYKFISEFRIEPHLDESGKIFLSNTVPEVLAAVNIHDRENVEFYSLQTGDLINTVEIENAFDLYGCGFNSSGQYFYCYSGLKTLFRISVFERNSINKKIEYSSFGSFFVYEDGNRLIINGFEGLTLINWDKKILQTINNPRANIISPSWSSEDTNQPWDSVFIYYIPDISGEDEGIHIAINAEGKKVWKKSNVEFTSLLAVSTDGEKQIWNDKGHVDISYLPTKKINRLELKGDYEAVFTPDGKHALLLAKLRQVDEDKENNTISYRRDNHRIRIFDTETGKEVISWNINEAKNENDSK